MKEQYDIEMRRLEYMTKEEYRNWLNVNLFKSDLRKLFVKHKVSISLVENGAELSAYLILKGEIFSLAKIIESIINESKV
jgi:hypothetical protein